MKRLFSIILAILCLLTMLSIPAFAANAGVEPYGTPGSGYDQKNFTFNRSTYTAKLICSLTVRMWPRVGARQSQKHKLTIKL